MEKLNFKEIELGFLKIQEAQLKTDAQLAKTDAQLSDWDVKMQELRETVKNTNIQLGGIGNSNGRFAEGFFYQSLLKKMKLGNVTFDEIEKNIKSRRKKLVDEYDIVLYNGDSIGLVEIKYSVTSAHLKKLITTKKDNFKILFPEFVDYKFYLGIAGFCYENDAVRNEAKKYGLAVLEPNGDHVEIDDSEMIAY